LSFAELREELSRVEAVVSEDKQSKRIVFVDEVNAPIEGQPAYGAFLTILQERQLQKHGYTSRLGPLAWVFAGTDYLVDEPTFQNIDDWLIQTRRQRSPTNSGTIDEKWGKELNWRTRNKKGLPPTMHAKTPNSWSDYAATKAPDFVARLDTSQITLNPTDDLELEGVNRCFVAATIIAAFHPHVKFAERRLFMGIKKWNDATNRELTKAISRALPTGDSVRLADLPDWARRKLTLDVGEQADASLMELQFEPS
jgi:hypothetical protein